MELARVHIFVSGKVQGAWYREGTKKEANKLKVFGWIKNLEDGRVEALLEGEKESLEKMLVWAKRGSFWSKVENIEISWEEHKKDFQDFKIVY